MDVSSLVSVDEKNTARGPMHGPVVLDANDCWVESKWPDISSFPSFMQGKGAGKVNTGYA